MATFPRRQPKVDRNHPVGKDIVWGCAHGFLGDIASSAVATVESPTSVHTQGAVMQFGRSIRKNTANDSNAIYWPKVPQIRRIKRNCTIVFWGTITTLASAFTSLVKVPYRTDGTWSAPYQALALDAGAGNEGSIEYAQNSSTGVSSGLVSSFYVTGGVHMWAGVRAGDGSSALFYRDGALFSSQTFGTNADIDFSGSVPEVNLMLSSQSANIANAPAATCYMAFIVSRAMTAREIRQHWQNPNAILLPPTRRIVAVPAAGPAAAAGPVAKKAMYHYRIRRTA